MEKKDEEFQQINILLGSCPECGKGVWSSDEITEARGRIDVIVYKCIQCKKVWKSDELVPF